MISDRVTAGMNLFCTRLTLIVTRSVSEGRNFCPRLRFGLRWNVPFLTACSLSSDALRGDLRLAELMAQIMGSILQIRLLEEQQARMTQFFSPKVAQTLISRGSEEALVPREDEFTVLFCDLRGFSRKSEKEQYDLMT